MIIKIKKTVGVLLLAILPVFSTSPALMAQPASDPSPGETSPEVQEPVDDYDMRPEIGRIEQGNKVGEKIKQFGAKASDRLGGWIDNKVFADISWLKLLFCLLLVFVVVTVERVIHLLIQRRIEFIPRVDGEISWVCRQLKIELLEKEYALSSGVQG